MSSFMFFNQSLIKKFPVSLLPDKNEVLTAQWRKFQDNNNPNYLIESGMNLAYKVFLGGLNWYKLKRSNKYEYHDIFAGVYEGYIFHLGAASNWHPETFNWYLKPSKLNNIKKSLSRILPEYLKTILRTVFPNRILFPESKPNQIAHEKIRRLLLDDTEKFLKILQEGEKLLDKIILFLTDAFKF